MASRHTGGSDDHGIYGFEASAFDIWVLGGILGWGVVSLSAVWCSISLKIGFRIRFGTDYHGMDVFMTQVLSVYEFAGESGGRGGVVRLLAVSCSFLLKVGFWTNGDADHHGIYVFSIALFTMRVSRGSGGRDGKSYWLFPVQCCWNLDFRIIWGPWISWYVQVWCGCFWYEFERGLGVGGKFISYTSFNLTESLVLG